MLTLEQLQSWARDSVRQPRSHSKLLEGETLTALRATPHRMVLVGNGLSRLANPRSPSWRRWLKPLLADRADFPPHYIESHLQLSEILDFVQPDLSAEDRRELWHQLASQTETVPHTPLHEGLLLSFDVIATTNYDTLLERAGLQLLADGLLDELRLLQFVGGEASAWICTTWQGRVGPSEVHQYTLRARDGESKQLVGDNGAPFSLPEHCGSRKRVVLKLHGSFLPPHREHSEEPRTHGGIAVDRWLSRSGFTSTVTGSREYSQRLTSLDSWTGIVERLKDFGMVALGYGFNPEDITIHHLMASREKDARAWAALLHGEDLAARFRYEKYGFSVSSFEAGHGTDAATRAAVLFEWLHALLWENHPSPANDHQQRFEACRSKTLEAAGYDPTDSDSGPRPRCVLIGQFSENTVLGIERPPQVEAAYRVLGVPLEIAIERGSAEKELRGEDERWGQRVITQPGGQMGTPAAFMSHWLKQHEATLAERIVFASTIGWDERGDSLLAFASGEIVESVNFDFSCVVRDHYAPTENSIVAAYGGYRSLLDVNIPGIRPQTAARMASRLAEVMAPDRADRVPRGLYLAKWFMQPDGLIGELDRWQRGWHEKGRRPWIFYETGGAGSANLETERLIGSKVQVDFVLSSLFAAMRCGLIPIFDVARPKRPVTRPRTVRTWSKAWRKTELQDYRSRKQVIATFLKAVAEYGPEVLQRLFDRTISPFSRASAWVLTLNELGAVVVRPQSSADVAYWIDAPPIEGDELRCALGSGDAFRAAFIHTFLREVGGWAPVEAHLSPSAEVFATLRSATRSGVWVGSQKVRYFRLVDAIRSISPNPPSNEVPSAVAFDAACAKKLLKRIWNPKERPSDLWTTSVPDPNHPATLSPRHSAR